MKRLNLKKIKNNHPESYLQKTNKIYNLKILYYVFKVTYIKHWSS